MEIVNKLFNLDGKVIIVAGGAGQIGFAFSEILADAGAEVIIADIDVEMAGQKVSSLTRQELKNKLHIYKLDVSQPEEVKSLYKQVREKHGKIYGLINSFHFKGNTRKLDTTSNFFAGFEEYPLEAWDAVHDINLKGSFLMSQVGISYFKENGGGVIVNISSTYGNVSPNKSIYGDSGINSPVAYATSKAALINLTRYMATHLAEHNIRVNVLSPGGVFNNQAEDFLKAYTNLTPLKRMAKAEDYQGAIVFLMSEASSYMTGSNLLVDGGWTAW
ncbi:MAG TPA: SDR family oxidoreductase [Cytophagaceae bacterium]|jgi:NAD(P)-dependent dehydrogenase (short-subunit alcohol dehydrogenase family)|nr:SDR family oxidoreductase [Cytophagaceae bacterium]